MLNTELLCNTLVGISLALDMDGHHNDAQAVRDTIAILKEHTVIYCRDCKYKPFIKAEYKDRKPKYPFIAPGGVEIEFPDDENNPCPYCGGSDPYNNIMPSDNFFCAYGKKMDGEELCTL